MWDKQFSLQTTSSHFHMVELVSMIFCCWIVMSSTNAASMLHIAGITFHSEAIAWPAFSENGFSIIGARASSTALCVLL
jgi:hypothetical protein